MKNLNNFELNIISGGYNICTPEIHSIAKDIKTCMDENTKCLVLAKYISATSLRNLIKDMSNCYDEYTVCIGDAILKKLK